MCGYLDNFMRAMFYFIKWIRGSQSFWGAKARTPRSQSEMSQAVGKIMKDAH